MASIDKRANGWKARWRTPLGESRSKTFKREADAEDTSDEVRIGQIGRRLYRHIDLSASPWPTGGSAIASTSHHDGPRQSRATTAVIRRWWLSSLGDRRLATITPAQVRSIVTAMTDKLQPSTVRTNLGVFRAVIEPRRRGTELIARSPVRGIPSAC